jgi:hypothetical protein
VGSRAGLDAVTKWPKLNYAKPQVPLMIHAQVASSVCKRRETEVPTCAASTSTFVLVTISGNTVSRGFSDGSRWSTTFAP